MTGNDNPDAPQPVHVTDDPGIEEVVVADAQERHPSSGEGVPSPPRHPGGGVRQAPRRKTSRKLRVSDPVIPGEILYAAQDVIINEGAPVTTLTVVNTADRPIQVGSHYHFAEVNPGLQFDREKAWGQRLDVLSGGSMRFEPGVTIEVGLIPIRGRRIVRGLRGEVGGQLDGSR
ncbi:MAG TPA: urease subunit beta [Flexivirga sp.]|uniref:urease subunit beta n=1 Tax=Flexivirga sp. TaxID=1962927 RepID=UPI002B74832B|nr:urease subunit beta [Flexivirga sp.]HWC24745.1 urease subunit beta [Flexivirga sp.]